MNCKKELIKILKKPTDSIMFRFYKLETEKTEPNRSQTKKTEPNYFEPAFIKKTEPNQTETGYFFL